MFRAICLHNNSGKAIEMIEQSFRYGTNSSIPSLWASMGYTYGKCARQLHYNNKFGKVSFTQREMDMMETGIETHNLVEQWLKDKFPDMAIKPEVKRSFDIALPDGTRFIIGAKADIIVNWRENVTEYVKTLIEIKYMYGRSAYYQTLIEKLVFYEMNVMCFQYGNLGRKAFVNNLLIPLKADLDMAKVYAGRIITSLYHLPPRFPNSHFNHVTCVKCMWREICYSNLDSNSNPHDEWNTFKSQSQSYIDSVRNAQDTRLLE